MTYKPNFNDPPMNEPAILERCYACSILKKCYACSIYTYATPMLLYAHLLYGLNAIDAPLYMNSQAITEQQS